MQARKEGPENEFQGEAQHCENAMKGSIVAQTMISASFEPPTCGCYAIR